MPRYTYNGVTVTATGRRPSTRDDKKYMRTVTVDGKDYLVHYGDPDMEMRRDNPDARENFLSRHSCGTKKDPLAPGFWACLDWARPNEGKNMNALKAVGGTDDHLIVENHIVLFGGRDLEGTVNNRENPDGSRGEFFGKSVDLRSPYTNTGVLYVDWEHGQADKSEPGDDDVLGYVDWTTAKTDDAGVLVQRILDRRNAFVRMIEPLIAEGLIGTSSEAIPQGVRKADNGEITRWPLRRDTLTVTPMEPRMLSQNALEAAKALAEKWPALKSAIAIDDEKTQTNQPGPETATVDIEHEPTPVTQNVALAAEPETEPEPDDTEQLAELLTGFLDNVTEILGVNNNG